MTLAPVDCLTNCGSDHRISNNLAMVCALLRRKARGLQARTAPVGADEARGALEEAAFQVEVIASLHKLLSNKPGSSRVDLDQYLRSVCNAAIPSLSTLARVTPEYKLGSGRSVAPDLALSIGLAVAELLINAIKYAHPSGVDGRIVVTAATRDDRLVIEVADDGVGLPEGYDPAADDNFGLRLVRQTAARWDGRVEFKSSERGLCVGLVLPADERRVDK